MSMTREEGKLQDLIDKGKYCEECEQPIHVYGGWDEPRERSCGCGYELDGAWYGKDEEE